MEITQELVMVMRRCVRCGHVTEEPLAKVSARSSLCDECNLTENFSEITGVRIWDLSEQSIKQLITTNKNKKSASPLRKVKCCYIHDALRARGHQYCHNCGEYIRIH